MRMTPVWILILSLCKTSLVQVVELYQLSLVSVKNGEAASLNCTFPHDFRLDFVVWYKQRPGELPQDVGTAMANSDHEISPRFLSSELQLKRIPNGLSLTIPHVKAEDEGMHFCGMSLWNKFTFSTGTFLAVKGHGVVNISVVQSPDVGRVSPGESMSLQCSVLSERRTAELQVFWFRASAGDSHPEIISTHHSSRQCEISSSPHSCVYNLSKSVLSVSDTGTYYCAVHTCGKILLGNGTTVVGPLDPIVICLGTALGVCVVVIGVQARLIQRKRLWEQPSVTQEGVETENTIDQDDGAEEIGYAAIHVNKGQTTTVKRGRHYDSLYSEVQCPAVDEDSLTQ
ncbi:uncharacterized protein LOC143526582 [Brachyhypopomus gauderio]|uniref:uncharacterized protein LOC143526582 n=1 Tax=Brachyhypopomus gauderio TaxID=698409 RepID=UPI0040414C8F